MIRLSCIALLLEPISAPTFADGSLQNDGIERPPRNNATGRGS